MNRFAPFLLTLLSVALMLPAGAEEAVQLRQAWQEGKRYTVSMKLDQSTNLTVAGQNVSQTMHMSSITSLTFRKHEDGLRKRISLQYERISIDSDTNGMKMSADSGKPDDSTPFGKTIGALVGHEIRMVADQHNKVESVEGVQEALAAAGENNLMAQQFLNEAALKRMVAQGGLDSVPDHPVKPGDSWPFSTEMPLPQMGQLNLKGTYTYEKTVQRAGVPCAEIAINSSMTGSDSGDTGAGIAARIEMGSIKGTVYFDNALGAARETDMEEEITVSMNNPVGGTERLTIPLTQKIHTAIDKIEDAP